MNFEKITKRCLDHWSCRVEQRLWEMSEFDVDLPSSSWRHVLYPLSWLGSITVLSLLFSLVRMHQRLNLINGLYALLFSVSAVGIPVEVSPDLSAHTEIVTPQVLLPSPNWSPRRYQEHRPSGAGGVSRILLCQVRCWLHVKTITSCFCISSSSRSFSTSFYPGPVNIVIQRVFRLIDTGRPGPQCML